MLATVEVDVKEKNVPIEMSTDITSVIRFLGLSLGVHILNKISITKFKNFSPREKFLKVSQLPIENKGTGKVLKSLLLENMVLIIENNLFNFE